MTSFVADGLQHGEHVIVLATHAHWNLIAAWLESDGADYGRASHEQRLVFIEADQILGDIDSAVAIERLGSDLSRTHNVLVLCGYRTDPCRPLPAVDVTRISEAHDRVYANKTQLYRPVPPG